MWADVSPARDSFHSTLFNCNQDMLFEQEINSISITHVYMLHCLELKSNHYVNVSGQYVASGNMVMRTTG